MASRTEETMEMDFERARRAAAPLLRVQKPVLLRGKHGIGKTSLIWQIAEEDLGVPVVERRISQMTPGDILGLPDRLRLADLAREILNISFNEEIEEHSGEDSSMQQFLGNIVEELPERFFMEENTTKFAPPEWFQFLMENEGLLSLEELDRGSKGVRQAIFELVGSGKLFGKELHSDTKIAGAINGGLYSHLYQVAELDLAQLNRWHVFDVTCDVDVWLDWSKGRDDIPDALRDFIAEHPDELMHTGEFQEGVPHKTPRMWHRVGKAIVKEREETGTDLLAEENRTILRDMAAGSVGRTAVNTLQTYLEDYERELKSDELLAGDWEEEDLENWSEVDHNTMIDKLKHSGHLDTFLKENEEFEEPYKNLAWYALHLDAENIVSFCAALVHSDVPEKNAAYWQTYEFENGRHKGKQVMDILQPRLAETVNEREDAESIVPNEYAEDEEEEADDEE